MKKLIIITLISFMLLGVSGCFKRDEFEDIDIYTTTYPIEFLTDTLYGYNSNVESVYPAGVNTDEYELTAKQVEDYSSGDVFIYNGLSNEKSLAKDFINKNKDLRIIDVSYGLNAQYGEEELWLSPNNYLMITTTVKNNLQEFIDNKYIKEEIDEKFKIELEDKLSLLDTEIRTIANNSNGSKPLIVTDNVFKYLEDYGFSVININDENLTQKELDSIVHGFNSDIYTYIIKRNDEEKNDLVINLETNFGAQVLDFNMLNTITDEQRKNNEDYFSLMDNNIELLKTAISEK